jgi:acyl phosphate:glycerol-3-phosphate acyltransferase
MGIVYTVAAAVIGYLLGSFPTGYLLARLKGVDPRQAGSGRTGGTNVLRTAGKVPALLTVIGDMLKGALAVWIARSLAGTDAAVVLAGLAAVVGHNHSVFLGFRGGAGSMTNVGVVLALAPQVVILIAVLGIGVGIITHTASLASIAAVVATLVGMVIAALVGWVPAIYVAYGIVVCAIILFELRSNIQRLRDGSDRPVMSY